MINNHVDDLLPFYINHTLSVGEMQAVETHLSVCPFCRDGLSEWRRLADSVQQGVTSLLPVDPGQLKITIPPLSPLVTASFHRRPTLTQASTTVIQLVWAQRVFLNRGWVFLLVGGMVLFGFYLVSKDMSWLEEWGLLPFFAAVPMIATLLTAFLITYDEDPAFEITASTPTSPGTLMLSRLTMALAWISLFAFSGSLLFLILGLQASLFDLVAVWLGPMLVLSALTTLLSVCLHPKAAAGASLTLWGSLLLLLYSEQWGAPVMNISFLWLLRPGWMLLIGQVLLAVFLWWASWLWVANSLPSLNQQEGRIG